jgi:hypothetical protein
MAIFRELQDPSKRRRSQRVIAKKRASLVINLASNLKRLPCLVVDSSKEGFRLRANLRVRRGEMVEVIIEDHEQVCERCNVVWVGKPETKQDGEVGVEIIRASGALRNLLATSA